MGGYLIHLFRVSLPSNHYFFILLSGNIKSMASTSNPNQISSVSFPSPSHGPFQNSILARVIKIEEKVNDSLQMLTEMQVQQLRMAREQEKQGKILRNLQKFLMDNHANPIVIKDSSNIEANEEGEEDEEEEEEEEPMEEETDDEAVCVGEVCFDAYGNIVEQHGNFCFHYPNCPVHKSPIVKNNH